MKADEYYEKLHEAKKISHHQYVTPVISEMCILAGYRLSTEAVMNSKGETNWNHGDLYNYVYQEGKYPVPTHEMLHMWIRNEHRLHVAVFQEVKNPSVYCRWSFKIHKIVRLAKLVPDTVVFSTNSLFDTYERAMEAGLLHALIEIIIKKEKEENYD